MNTGIGFLTITLICFFSLVGVGATETYVVQPSETLYSISKKYGVSVAHLQRTNKITDVRKLRIGQRLVIPSVKASSKNAPSVAMESTSRLQASPRPSKKYLRVVLDAGHGGKDKGASWYGVRESDLNLKVARKLEVGLQSRGYEVTMTRRSDVFLSLSKRAQIGNRYRNSIFVSIHFNAASDTRVRGAETFYAGSKKGHLLASSIQSELVRRLNLVNRGARIGRYTVLRETSCPAVLVECGFISNSSERARCKTSWYQAACAQAIISGIERYDRVY